MLGVVNATYVVILFITQLIHVAGHYCFSGGLQDLCVLGTSLFYSGSYPLNCWKGILHLEGDFTLQELLLHAAEYSAVCAALTICMTEQAQKRTKKSAGIGFTPQIWIHQWLVVFCKAYIELYATQNTTNWTGLHKKLNWLAQRMERQSIGTKGNAAQWTQSKASFLA